MKAYIYNQYGPADVLELDDFAMPKIEADQVLVRIKAVGLNPVDYKIRSGDLKLFTGKKFPKQIGADLAGVVEKVGKNVTTFQVGDEVFGMLDAMKGGAYAEFAAVSENALAYKPQSISFEEAAGLPVAALTALHGLHTFGKVKENMKVLVNGSSGGVGTFAVQIAKAFGAHVTAVCSTRNIAQAKELGTDEIIDYTKDNIFKTAEKYDIFFDAVGSKSFLKVRKYLNINGLYTTTLPGPSSMLTLPFVPLLGSKKLKMIMISPKNADFKTLSFMIGEEKIKTVIDKVYPFNEAVEAQEYLETGKAQGKVILSLESEKE